MKFVTNRICVNGTQRDMGSGGHSMGTAAQLMARECLSTAGQIRKELMGVGADGRASGGTGAAVEKSVKDSRRGEMVMGCGVARVEVAVEGTRD